ncbi:hypothetical protein [Synechococcus sp. MU1655]|uniref:hypothetical protein n=1 Tax=Synechococcus sp. MU1655 TaxID=2508355 RepID=UPI0020270048|nr:hypothetical protein [Synechococcus sp. MU1655]
MYIKTWMMIGHLPATDSVTANHSLKPLGGPMVLMVGWFLNNGDSAWGVSHHVRSLIA